MKRPKRSVLLNNARFKPARLLLLLLMIFLFAESCSDKGAAGIFAKRTPYEKYADQLTATGLIASNLGKRWIEAGKNSLAAPKNIKLPYQETGYFAADRPAASTYYFTATRGEKITLVLNKKPIENFMIYLDVWESDAMRQPGKLIASIDTNSYSLSFEAGTAPGYLVRFQPELLSSGAFTLTITNAASLGFPVQGKTKVQSFWGDGRDNNSRKHEGVDIFASKGTPALAAANGNITRVGTNILGGNVVFMRPEGKDYTLYYAHLDKQTVADGQTVKIGDTLGLVGNTGNAITTTPHLHFGIYTFSGAVDPYPFISTTVRTPPAITGNIELNGENARAKVETTLFAHADRTRAIGQLPKNTPFRIMSATADLYKVLLPDGSEGYIRETAVSTLSKITTSRSTNTLVLLEKPDLNAPPMRTINAGEPTTLLGSYNNFNYIDVNGLQGWVVK